MGNLLIDTNPVVEEVFNNYPNLVPTFKTVYGNIFRFEGDRAIIFKMGDSVPESELKKCIKAALLYHKVKNIPGLGI